MSVTTFMSCHQLSGTRRQKQQSHLPGKERERETIGKGNSGRNPTGSWESKCIFTDSQAPKRCRYAMVSIQTVRRSKRSAPLARGQGNPILRGSEMLPSRQNDWKSSEDSTIHSYRFYNAENMLS